MSKDYYLYIPTKKEFNLVIEQLEKLERKNKGRFERSILLMKFFAYSGLRQSEAWHFDFEKHIIRDIGKYGTIKLIPVKCDCKQCKRRMKNYWLEYESKTDKAYKRYKKRRANYWTPKSEESQKAFKINKPLYDVIKELRKKGIHEMQDYISNFDTFEYQIRKINNFLPWNYPKRKKITAHNLRRYYISQTLDKYQNSISASRLARHKSPATTKLYAREPDKLGEDMSYEDL